MLLAAATEEPTPSSCSICAAAGARSTAVEACVVAGRVARASGIMVEAALPQVAVGTSARSGRPGTGS